VLHRCSCSWSIPHHSRNYPSSYTSQQTWNLSNTAVRSLYPTHESNLSEKRAFTCVTCSSKCSNMSQCVYFSPCYWAYFLSFSYYIFLPIIVSLHTVHSQCHCFVPFFCCNQHIMLWWKGPFLQTVLSGCYRNSMTVTWFSERTRISNSATMLSYWQAHHYCEHWKWYG
jgi:hypothetical protein